MKRLWIIVLLSLVFVGILSFPRLFLLSRVEEELQAELAAALGTEQLELALRAPWGWELVLGHIPGLSLAARNAVLEGVEAAAVHLKAEEILFQPWTLFSRGELVLSGISQLTGFLVITEQALNEVFWREVDPSRQLWLEVSPEGLALVGTVNIWNAEVSLRILSQVVVEGGALRFVVKDVAVQEARIPPLLLEAFGESYNFSLDVGELPLGVEMQGVELLDHEIKIRIGGQQ